MDEVFGIPLVTLGLAMRTQGHEYSVFIDRKEDYVKKLKFHTTKYVDDMVQMNPSLALVNDKEKSQCVFFNSFTDKCSIYITRPLACKTFPYIFDERGKLKTYQKFCPKTCFTKGKIENWEKVAEDVVVMWSNIEGLKKWTRNRVGTTIYKDTTINPENRTVKNIQKVRSIAKSKSKQTSLLGKFYENMITTFYLCTLS